MDRYTVICHRCGKSTFVDLSKTISDQRCRACGGFLQGVDVSTGEDRTELRRKLVIRNTGDGGREPEWQDQEMAVMPVRHLWPRAFSWVILITGACFAFIILKILYAKSTTGGDGSKAVSTQEEPGKEDVRITAAWRTRATDLARKAVAAKTTAELLPLLYHPDVEIEFIRSYYSAEETLPLGTDLDEAYFIPEGSYTENFVAFNYTDSAKHIRAMVVVEKPDGMKIDWPSLVGLGEMSLKNYILNAPEGVIVMRARARIGNYYNNHFSDSKRWLSVRLSDVTDEHVLHAYYDRRAPGADTLEQELPKPDTTTRADDPIMVVIKHQKGDKSPDQTQLIALLSRTWYHQDGLQPFIDQARKLDAVLSALPGDSATKDTPSPAPENSKPPQNPAPAPQTPPAVPPP